MVEIKRGRGRPRKPADSLTPAQFGRDALILSAYDRIRAVDQKHSEAVKEVVAQIKGQHPGIRISEGTVRRTLALWRPRSSHSAIIFEDILPSQENLEHRAWRRQEIAKRESGKRSADVEDNSGPTKSGSSLSIRFGPRPVYPRFNRKSRQ